MKLWSWTPGGILAVAIIIASIMAAVIILLLLKIHTMRTAAKEIETAFADRLMTDTNTLIDISSADQNMRRLANSINRELRKLREARRRFEQGDLELKNAVTNISHDLRTPLTAICGYLDLLETGRTVSSYYPEQGGAFNAADGTTVPVFSDHFRGKQRDTRAGKCGRRAGRERRLLLYRAERAEYRA